MAILLTHFGYGVELSSGNFFGESAASCVLSFAVGAQRKFETPEVKLVSPLTVATEGLPVSCRPRSSSQTSANALTSSPVEVFGQSSSRSEAAQRNHLRIGIGMPPPLQSAKTPTERTTRLKRRPREEVSLLVDA